MLSTPNAWDAILPLMVRPKHMFTANELPAGDRTPLDPGEAERLLKRKLSDDAMRDLQDIASVYAQRTSILATGIPAKVLEASATAAISMVGNGEKPAPSPEWAAISAHIAIWKKDRNLDRFSAQELDPKVLRVLVRTYRGGASALSSVTEHHNWVALVHELRSWCRYYGIPDGYSAGKEGQRTPPLRALLDLLTATLPVSRRRDYVGEREDPITGIESQIKAIRRALAVPYPYGADPPV
jgi:hypothetical protein